MGHYHVEKVRGVTRKNCRLLREVSKKSWHQKIVKHDFDFKTVDALCFGKIRAESADIMNRKIIVSQLVKSCLIVQKLMTTF